MKRLILCLLVMLLIGSLGIQAMAATEASRVYSASTVHQDGSCDVVLTFSLHLDSNATNLTFPLPGSAKDVLLNGSFVTTTHSGDQLLVQLPNFSAGDHQFTLAYRLEGVVSREKDGTIVQLELLSGFSLPIRALEFSVTLPGDITGTPSFTSGYHQEDISGAMAVNIAGNTMTVSVQQPLKDHETLAMLLPAEVELFPEVDIQNPIIDFWDGAVLVCAVLAVAYYLLTLMPRVNRRSRCFSPPEGISAGEVGVCLTGTGVDLTLMVLTWAQLGYVQIEVVDKRRVLLHKRMEMGNERSQFEMRAFQNLFGNRRVLDGTGVHYARQYRKTALQAPMRRQFFKPGSGLPILFLLLSCAAGVFSGVKMGLAITDIPALQVLLCILACILCGAFSYSIQAGGKCLPLRNKVSMWIALCCSAAWIALGVVTDRTGSAITMVLFQLTCGIAIAFGGWRSELGKRSLSQIRGLRRYMLHVNTFELQQRLQVNSNYFFELAPYALALGVDRRFARRFGKTPMPDCGFLILPGKNPTTAAQWATVLRKITDTLNARQKRLPYERVTGRTK